VSGTDDGRERPSGSWTTSQLTGELPRFVRDALGRPRAIDEVLDEDAASTAAALVDLGLSEVEARKAVLEGRVPLVLAQRVIGEEPRHTLEDLASEVDVPAELLRQIRIASGLPLPTRYSDADVRWGHHLARLLDVLPPEAVIRSARARGTALSTVARSDLGVVRDEVLLPLRQAGADDLTVAVTLAETAKHLDALAREVLVITYGLHLQHQLGSELSAVLTRSDVVDVDLAAGFVDVVGWTSLSSRVDPAGLDEVLDLFQARVVELTAPEGDVTVVKYLGDAAMLVAPDVPTLLGVMVELTTPVPDLEDVPLRGGLAAGSTLVREGDIYGPPVNLAARLTDLARPWSLLVDDELADRIPDRYAVRRLRPMRIRGVGVRRPLSVSGGR
jgi:adenylate cyclase